MFRVGLETRLEDLARTGRPAALAGTLGIVLPFVGGLGAAFVLGYTTPTAVFVGAALVATSTAVTARVMMDIGILSTPVARTIIGAAILDDILAMLVLAVASGLASGGGLGLDRILILGVLSIGFVATVLLAGTHILRRRGSLLRLPVISHLAWAVFAHSPLLPGMLLMLGLAALAAAIGLAAIIGALLAGMVIAESAEREAIEREVAPVTAFFAPIFFGAIGLQVDLSYLTSGDGLVVLGVLTLLAVATKFVGAFLGAFSLGPRTAAVAGWGMVPRGEVGIVIASLGLGAGVIDAGLYSVVVGVALITTLIVPPALPALYAWASSARSVPPSTAPNERNA